MSILTRKPPALCTGRFSRVWRQIPNVLTTLRVVCTIGIFTWSDTPILVFVLTLVGAVSDALDGYLAKRFNWSTVLGKRYDQYTDWLFGIALLYAIYRAEGLIWYDWPYNGALLIMVGGYLLVRAALPNVDTTGAAKLKTFLQFAGAVGILAGHALGWDAIHFGGYLLVWSSIGLMGKSLWDYLRARC